MKRSQISHNCRNCTNSLLRSSRSVGVKDWLLKCVGLVPMRCHRCGKRYHLAAMQTQEELPIDEMKATSN